MSDASWLTAGLAGTGGSIKESPEDFEVEEIADRPPTGAGRFVRAFIEKRGISTPELLRRLGAALECPSRHFGVAGYKDAAAVTRQWVSAPADRTSRLAQANILDVKVLRLEPDIAPLHAGELGGNKFRVTVRGVGDRDVAVSRAERVVAELARRGTPNFFGPQRFGVRGESAEVGRRLIVDEPESALDLILGAPSERELDPRAAAFRRAYDAGDLRAAREHVPRALRLEAGLLDQLVGGAPKSKVARRLPVRERRFFLSAWQALIFNRVLARRLDRIDVALRGDLLLGATGPARECVDPTFDREAVAALTLHPTAPLPGGRVPLAKGEPGEIERAVLAEAGIPEERLARAAGLPLDGERRPVRFVARELSVAPGTDPDSITLSFTLPKGCFATALLAEVTKSSPPVR